MALPLTKLAWLVKMNLFTWLLTVLGLGKSAAVLVKKADGMAAKEDVMAAVEAYKEAQGSDPEFVAAYDGLGKLFFRMGFRDEADREFAIADGLEALGNDPNNVEAAVKMGRAFMDKGLNSLSIRYLEPLLANHPHNTDLLKVLGLNYRNTDELKKGRECLRAGLDLRPCDPDFYMYLGQLEIKAGNKAEAENLLNISRLLSKALADPLDAQSRHELMRYFAARGLHNEAAEYGRQALQIAPENAEAWLYLAEVYQTQGLDPAALDALNQAARLLPEDPRPHKALGTLLHKMGRFADARSAKELAQVLEGGQDGPMDAQQAARYVKLLLGRGKQQEAEKRLEDYVRRWPESQDLLLLQGRALFKKKHFKEAAIILSQVAQEKEGWAEPHIWLAMCYQQMGDKMSALAEGQLAIRLAPKSHVAHKVLGDIYREQKKFSMAENAYEMAENLKASQKKK